MKVWLLWADEDYEASELIGIYSNQEKAKNQAKLFRRKYEIWQEALKESANCFTPKYTAPDYRVEEAEVIQ